MSTSRAIVLARGVGSRMRAPDAGAILTPEQAHAADAGLKAMMPVNGRPFLDFVLSAVADAGIETVALIVAPEHAEVRRYYESDAPPARLGLDFVVQQEPLGTANAVLAAEAWTRNEPFLTINADNLYPACVLRDLAQIDGPALAAFSSADLIRHGNIPAERIGAFASVQVDERGFLARIVEKPGVDPDTRRVASRADDELVSMNCWRFDTRIFEACRAVPRSSRGEFELPQAVGLAVSRGVPFQVLRASGVVLDLSKRADAVDVATRLRAVVARP
jgi:dTDP-glucose pyrophosphorylase